MDQVSSNASDQSVKMNAQLTSSTNVCLACISAKAFDIKKAQVNVDVDSASLREEAFSLEQELNKFVNWGDASDLEIEEHMAKVETWNKRMVKIREKVEDIERNTKIYDLEEVTMVSSVSVLELIDCQMEITVENLKFEDEKRCLYSLNKSKTDSEELPTFLGDQEGDSKSFQIQQGEEI